MRIRGQDIGDALRGVEPRDLNDVVAVGVVEGSHPIAETRRFELMHVVLVVPVRHLLVQAIEPVRRRREVSHLRGGHRLGHELANGMADEEISLLNVAPDPVPDFGLGGAFCIGEVGADLDVGAEDDGAGGVLLLRDFDEDGHLGVVDYDDVGAAFGAGGERAAFGDPVAVGVLAGPGVEGVNFVGAEAGGVLAGDVLEDIVVVFGDAEDLGLGFGDVPGGVCE